MKITAFMIVFANMFVAFGQDLNKDAFCEKEWLATKTNYDVNVKSHLVYTHLHVIADATSYKFNSDGSFDWNDNPSCGTNANKTSGKGNWKYANHLLTLDFKNVNTEQRGKRSVEKYKMIKLEKEELILQRQ